MLLAEVLQVVSQGPGYVTNFPEIFRLSHVSFSVKSDKLELKV